MSLGRRGPLCRLPSAPVCVEIPVALSWSVSDSHLPFLQQLLWATPDGTWSSSLSHVCARAPLLLQDLLVHGDHYPSYVWAFLYLKHPEYGRLFKKKKDIFFCRMMQCPVSSDVKAATVCSHCSRSVSLCSLLLHNGEDGCVEALQWRSSSSPPRPGGPEPARPRPGKKQSAVGFGRILFYAATYSVPDV